MAKRYQSRRCFLRHPLVHAHIMIDMSLDAKVFSALERSPYLAGRRLRFETKHGQVTLRGVVRSYFQKQMAQEALRPVDGIHEIRNELEVTGLAVMPF